MFRTSGMTAAAVLVVAIVGGAAGGAMVLGGGSEPAAQPRPVQMGLKVAEEAPAAAGPIVTPGPTMVASPTPAPAEEPATVPVEEEPVASKTETAKESADRAEKAANRAEDAAENAEQVTSTAPAPATPKPTPVPVLEVPASQMCTEGEVRSIGRYDEMVCRDGKMVSAAPNRHCKLANPTEYVESGATVKRTVSGKEYTYRCEDGKLTLLED